MEIPGQSEEAPTSPASKAEAQRNRELWLARRSREVAYVDMYANPEAGSISIAFRSVDDGSTFRPEEWIPRAETLWGPLLGIVGVFCGEDSSRWILSRARARFSLGGRTGENQPFPGHVVLDRTVVGMKMASRWKSVEVMIVLAEWVLTGAIEQDLIHLYVTPYAVYEPVTWVAPDDSDESSRRAREVGGALNSAVSRFMAAYLSDDSMRVEFIEPVWGEENQPVGGASSFEYIGVITNGRVNRPAIS